MDEESIEMTSDDLETTPFNTLGTHTNDSNDSETGVSDNQNHFTNPRRRLPYEFEFKLKIKI